MLSPDSILPAPVLLVEDESVICSRLQSLLEQLGYAPDAVIVASSLAQARSRLINQPVALALVDIGLPDGSGIDLIAEMRVTDPSVAIIVISAYGTADAILSAIRAGATGYVLKERDDVEITLSIRSAIRGGAPIDPFIARRIIDEMRPQATPKTPIYPDDALTSRESEILGFVAQGLNNREIAEQLGLSRNTIECHIKHIYSKLAVSSRTRAVYAARTLGLLP